MRPAEIMFYELTTPFGDVVESHLHTTGAPLTNFPIVGKSPTQHSAAESAATTAGTSKIIKSAT